VNLQISRLTLQDHHHHNLLQKVTYPLTPGGFRPLPKHGLRKDQNVNEKKKTVILTYALPSMLWTIVKRKAWSMGPRKGARGVCNISIETRDSQNKKPKKNQEIEECKRRWRRRLQGYFLVLLSWRTFQN
jgi:hypothetical protein